MKPKKKVGRPITYNGDPNAPELSEAERRKVKRRIANRESARRVQQRRKEMIDELQHKVCAFGEIPLTYCASKVKTERECSSLTALCNQGFQQLMYVPTWAGPTPQSLSTFLFISHQSLKKF